MRRSARGPLLPLMRPAAPSGAGALLLAAGLLVSVGAPPVAAVAGTSIVVNTLADAVANDGACSLREAIIAANTNTASGAATGECPAGSASGTDLITFSVSGTITLTSALPTISSDLTIDGDGAITVDGARAYQPFNVASGIVTLAGLAVTRGDAENGGGIANAGTLTVTDSTISGSSAGHAVSTGGMPIGSGQGGGMYNSAGTLTVTDSTISGNSTYGFGGGIANAGTLTVTDTTITGNGAGWADAGLGGGIFNTIGTLIVTNSTISRNGAGAGGGIFNGPDNGGTVTIASSTISGNYQMGLGGAGIYNQAGTLNATNSIISGNGEEAGIVNNPGGTLTVRNSITDVPSGTNLADILDPAGLANHGGPTRTIALALKAGNPAIDTGDATACATAPVSNRDQRGMTRVVGASCDIGAYEAQAPTITTVASVGVAATSAAGAIVSYASPVGTDERGGVAGVACTPASGSTFPPGATSVTCTATDGAGHTAASTFTVTVAALTASPSPSPSHPPLPAITSSPSPSPSHPPLPAITPPPTTTGEMGSSGIGSAIPLVMLLAVAGLALVATLAPRRPR